MTTQVNTKVRLVRCPKCRQLLAELPDVSLYKCGGCGTVLQAKKRTQEAMSCIESSPQGTPSVASSQQDNASVKKEAGRSNEEGSTRPSSVESSPGKDSYCCNNRYEDLSEGSSKSSVANGPASSVQIKRSSSEEVQESLVPENASVEKEAGSFVDGLTRPSFVESSRGEDSCRNNNDDDLSEGSSSRSDLNGPSSSVQSAISRGEGDQESLKPDKPLAQISEGEGSDDSKASTSVQITISWAGDVEESMKPDETLAQSSDGEGSDVGSSSSPPVQVTNSQDEEVQESLKLDEPLAHDSVGNGNTGSNGSSGSFQANISQREDTAMGIEESLKQGNLVGRNSEGYNSKSWDENGQWSRGSSDGIPSLAGSTCGADLDVPEVHEYGQGRKEDGDFIDEIRDLPELEDDDVLPQDIEDRGVNDEVRDVDEHHHVLPQDDGRSCTSSIDQNRDCRGGLSPDLLDSDSEAVSPESTDIPQPAEQSTDVDKLYASGKALVEKNNNGSARFPVVASQRSRNESFASFYLTCPDDEHTDHSPRKLTRKYGRVSSIDTFGSSSPAELGYESVAKYPPASSYYADDGSESSYEGIDDQPRERIPLRNPKNAGYISTEEMLRNGDFLGNGEPERRYWATSSSNRAAKGGHWGPAKSTEVNGYNSRNSLRPRKTEDISRSQPASRDPVASHRTTSPGSRHNLLPPRPGFNSSDTGSYMDADKRELLRKVFELKDQLNRMQLPKVPAHRRFPPEAMNVTYSPFHYDHLLPERDICSGLNHHEAYHLRCDQGQSFAEGCGLPRPAFSGEAVHYRHRHGCACLHCHPQDWHYSAQLPCKSGCCTVHSDHSLISGGVSPQHYTSSELSLWGCETMSSNQRLDGMKRLRLKEKYQTAKQRLLPVANGAPFISCYHCFALLQLPVDFLVLKRKHHQLRCNACRKILKFSLLKGTQLVPLLPDESPPPNSVAGNYKGSGISINHEQMSVSSSCQHGEAMSYTDNGQSFCRSCSTEGEASAISSLAKHAGIRSHYNRKMSSGSSFEPLEDRKMKSISREDPHRNGTRAVHLVGPSSQRTTSEIEEVPSNSPLHRLMGYSSPSQVF